MTDEIRGPKCPPDMPHYAAIDPVFCHSGNPSGRTGRANRHGNDHADFRSLDSTYRAGESDSSALTSSPWISTKIIRASAASAAARSAATAETSPHDYCPTSTRSCRRVNSAPRGVQEAKDASERRRAERQYPNGCSASGIQRNRAGDPSQDSCRNSDRESQPFPSHFPEVLPVPPILVTSPESDYLARHGDHVNIKPVGYLPVEGARLDLVGKGFRHLEGKGHVLRTSRVPDPARCAKSVEGK